MKIKFARITLKYASNGRDIELRGNIEGLKRLIETIRYKLASDPKSRVDGKAGIFCRDDAGDEYRVFIERLDPEEFRRPEVKEEVKVEVKAEEQTNAQDESGKEGGSADSYNMRKRKRKPGRGGTKFHKTPWLRPIRGGPDPT